MNILAEAAQITPDSGISVTMNAAIVVGIAICGFVARCTWMVAALIRRLDEVSSRMGETWSIHYQKDFAHALERRNARLRPDASGFISIEVPDPEHIRRAAMGLTQPESQH